jgi:hypothetical protein
LILFAAQISIAVACVWSLWASGLRELYVHVCATIFREKANEVRRLTPVHSVVDKAARTPRAQQAGAGKRVEMVRECGTGHPEPALDLIDAVALRPGADQQPEDAQAILLSQGAELFDPPLHYDISSIIEMIYEIKRAAPDKERSVSRAPCGFGESGCRALRLWGAVRTNGRFAPAESPGQRTLQGI